MAVRARGEARRGGGGSRGAEGGEGERYAASRGCLDRLWMAAVGRRGGSGSLVCMLSLPHQVSCQFRSTSAIRQASYASCCTAASQGNGPKRSAARQLRRPAPELLPPRLDVRHLHVPAHS